MKGKWLVVLALLAVVVACALVACTPDGTQTPAGQDNQIEVTNGTAAVFAAMKQSCSLSGDIEAFYLAFDLRREKEGDYIETTHCVIDLRCHDPWRIFRLCRGTAR